MGLEFSRRIERIPAYPVADAYGERAPRVRLASNEAPFETLPAVRDALAAHAAELNRYPDPSAGELRRLIAERHEVPAGHVVVGNGSCEVLMLLGEALLEPGAEIVHAWPSFSVYPHLSAASGARAVTVPLDGEHRHDLDAMAREVTVATRVVIVCNPNNPTSTALPVARIAEFVERIPPYVCVILDEAYSEYNLLDDPAASVALLEHHPNLVLLRTFSKVYGLAGLRVGYALCGSHEVPLALNRVRQPFNVSTAAQAAASAALGSQDAIVERVARTVAERISVAERLAAMGLAVADSQANFCWLLLGADRDEAAVVAALMERGILVRAGAALGASEPALRVTYGLPQENSAFLDALAEILGA
ncbi:MAG TPA: histidinol-phosphate transaminase [Solirubrobacteraceae bacterium]|nr:histidinol-phosphate transaminase [Solirubrobacteraceae bacterium]